MFDLYSVPFFGRRILSHIAKKEGGPQESTTIREYYSKKYHVDVALYSYGSCFSPEFCRRGAVKIGKYTSVGPIVKYFGSNHPINFASTSPYFYNESFGYKVKGISFGQLDIGNDVWIGNNVTITARCTKIGNGAVIGAGAIVTKDVEPYSIVGGNPAKKIRMRFTKEQIDALEASKWFELTPDELMDFYDYIEDPLEFARRVGDYRANRQLGC